MPRDDLIMMEGVVDKAMGGGFYKVLTVPENESQMPQEIIAKVCGKMKMNKIRILAGDKVSIGISPYDLTRGTIQRRHKQ